MITAAFPRPLVRHVAGLSGEVPQGDACGDNTALCAAIKAAPASPNVAVDRGVRRKRVAFTCWKKGAAFSWSRSKGCHRKMFDLPPVAIGKMMHKYNQNSTVIHIAKPSQL